VDLSKHKQSDVLFILGTGPSINRISHERWQVISRHDTLGVNFWLYHQFVPRFYVVESSSYIDSAETCRHITQLANRRGSEYVDTIKILTDLYQPGRQWVFDLGPDFRKNLYVADNLPLPARTEREFEYGIRYLTHKGVFNPATRLRALFKHQQSLSLLLSFAFRLRYRKIVLCGVDLNTNDHFYDDPELYPGAGWGTELRSADPVKYGWRYDDQLPWMVRQTVVVSAMKRLLLDPEGIELYVENRSSALCPMIPEAPVDLFAS